MQKITLLSIEPGYTQRPKTVDFRIRKFWEGFSVLNAPERSQIIPTVQKWVLHIVSKSSDNHKLVQLLLVAEIGGIFDQDQTHTPDRPAGYTKDT